MCMQERIFVLFAAVWSVSGQSLIRGGVSSTGGSTTSMTERILSSSICNNNALHTEVDAGCNADFPMCTQESGWEPPANVAGDFCAKCINIYDSDIATDLGCSKDFPRCNAPLGQAGLACLAPETSTCQNTALAATADQGCSAKAPVCYGIGTGMDVGYGAAGTGCARCINTFSQGHHDVGWADYGCPLESPRCVSWDGNEAPENQIGARCCPASGCATACPCNTPNSYFEYIVKKGGNLAAMTVQCWESSRALLTEFNFLMYGGQLAAGEPMAGSHVYACLSGSSGGFTGNVGMYGDVTQAQSNTCIAEMQGALAARGVTCSPF